MPITASAVTVDAHAQVDGRYWITETHALTAGEPITIEYLGDPANAAAVMAARVPQINEQLAQSEIAGVLDGA